MSRAQNIIGGGGLSWKTATPSPVAENGFQTVQRRKASKQGLSVGSTNSGLAPLGNVPPIPKIPSHVARRTNAPSVAATARTSVYAARPNKGSFYKESCLPVADRDLAVMAVQNSKGSMIAKESYRPGMLIRAAMHEPDLNTGGAGASTATVADRYRSETKFGPIHTKIRKAIVIALYQDHYLAVPLFTHNGKGLLKKLKPDEFISVRDHRSKGEFQTLSKHAALVTEQLNAGVDPLHLKSTAHITYPIARKYDLPVVHEGHLKPSSTNKLIELFNRYAPRAAKM